MLIDSETCLPVDMLALIDLALDVVDVAVVRRVSLHMRIGANLLLDFLQRHKIGHVPPGSCYAGGKPKHAQAHVMVVPQFIGAALAIHEPIASIINFSAVDHLPPAKGSRCGQTVKA